MSIPADGDCTESPMVHVEGISKVYQRGTNPVVALRDVSFSVRTGEFAALLGASGSGKSTLLNLIGGLDFPTAGDVLIDDKSLKALPDAELTLMRRRQIGMVFQFFNLLPNLSASENVALPLLLEGTAPLEVRERVDMLLRSVNLDHRKSHLPHELSGGEMQRVAIARALANSPKVLLADEPTGNLDSRTGEQILRLIRETSLAARCTVILATHSPAAAEHADRIISLRDGMVLGEGA